MNVLAELLDSAVVEDKKVAALDRMLAFLG